MESKILFGIDGISYSGKTTLCDKIMKLDSSIAIVSESPKFANTKIIISDDTESILKNSQATLEIETLRTSYVLNEINKNVFLFDRTIFSFIAISYAYYKSGMVNYFNEYIDEIIDGIIKAKYLVPDYLTFLSISENELKKRMMLKKKNLPNYWVSKEFNNSIEEILKIIFEFYQKNNRNVTQEELLSIDKEKLTKIRKEDVIVLLKGLKI